MIMLKTLRLSAYYIIQVGRSLHQSNESISKKVKILLHSLLHLLMVVPFPS